MSIDTLVRLTMTCLAHFIFSFLWLKKQQAPSGNRRNDDNYSILQCLAITTKAIKYSSHSQLLSWGHEDTSKFMKRLDNYIDQIKVLSWNHKKCWACGSCGLWNLSTGFSTDTRKLPKANMSHISWWRNRREYCSLTRLDSGCHRHEVALPD